MHINSSKLIIVFLCCPLPLSLCLCHVTHRVSSQFVFVSRDVACVQVIRDMDVGDEVMVYYGDFFFGENNEHCGCKTCQRLVKHVVITLRRIQTKISKILPSMFRQLLILIIIFPQKSMAIMVMIARLYLYNSLLSLQLR